MHIVKPKTNGSKLHERKNILVEEMLGGTAKSGCGSIFYVKKDPNKDTTKLMVQFSPAPSPTLHIGGTKQNLLASSFQLLSERCYKLMSRDKRAT